MDMRNLIGVVVSLSYIMGVLLFSSKMTWFGVEFSRKFAHMMIANWWFIGNYFFTNVYVCSLVPIIVGVIMASSYKWNLFKGIERPGQKKSYGTVYYFISIFILVNISFRIYGNMIPMGICFVPLGYGDGVAALVGKKLHRGCFYIKGREKSLSGSLAMLMVSLASMVIYNVVYNLDFSIQKLVILSLAATIIEGVSVNGTDNLTIPLGTFVVSCLV